MAIESEVEVLKSVVSKLDTSIEKITAVSGDIGKILAVHESRLNALDKVSDNRDDDIKELHSRITTGNRELMEKMVALEEKLETKLNESGKQATLQHNGIRDEVLAEFKTLEKRVHILEKWKWYVIGGASAFGYVLGHLEWIGNILK